MREPSPLDQAKTDQRITCRARLASMSPAEHAAASRSICEHLQRAAASITSGMIMGFLPLADEPDIRLFLQSMIDQGRVVGVPRILDSQHMDVVQLQSLEQAHLVGGAHGVTMPKDEVPLPVDNIGMIIVPGVAFDQQGHRLGRGGGYYDRFLARLPSSIPTIGCCFGCQLVEHVETGPMDVSMSKILMEDVGH